MVLISMNIDAWWRLASYSYFSASIALHFLSLQSSECLFEEEDLTILLLVTELGLQLIMMDLVLLKKLLLLSFDHL